MIWAEVGDVIFGLVLFLQDSYSVKFLSIQVYFRMVKSGCTDVAGI